MTDPKYLGKRLTSVQENEAEKWLQENYPQFLTGVLKFKIKDSEIFSPLLFTETVIEQFPAKKWWSLAKTKASKSTSLLPDGFCDFFLLNYIAAPQLLLQSKGFFLRMALFGAKYGIV